MTTNGSDESYMTMVLAELQLTDAIQLIKQYPPDYYSDNDESLVLNKFLDPTRFGYIEILQQVNNTVLSEPITPKTLKMFGIRADLLVQLRKFRMALADTDEILKRDPTDTSAIRLKAEALMGLNMYDTARAFLAPYLTWALPPNKSDAICQLHLQVSMLSGQMQKGIYPWREISDKYRSGFEGYMRWAEYEGRITVKDTTDGKGRGLFAKKDFNAGELILSSKAFSVFDTATRSLPLIGAGDTEVNTLAKAIIKSLRQNPNACKSFYKLYAGPGFQNVSPPVLNMQDEENDFIDEERVEEICKYNYFYEGNICGVWNLPSYMNHSCYDCNSSRMIYGDFMFIRAFKDIKEGEEITTSYICFENFPGRWKLLEEYGITCCTCSLCKFDRKEPKSVQDEKQELLAKLEALDIIVVDCRRCFSEQSVDQAVEILERLLELRPIYNAFLLPYSEQIGWHYYFKENFPQAFQYFVISYNAIKNSAGLTFEAYHVCAKIVEVLLLADDFDQATKWLDILHHAATLAFGSPGILEYKTLENWKHALGTARNDPKHQPEDSLSGLLPTSDDSKFYARDFYNTGGCREINGYGFVEE